MEDTVYIDPQYTWALIFLFNTHLNNEFFVSKGTPEEKGLLHENFVMEKAKEA